MMGPPVHGVGLAPPGVEVRVAVPAGTVGVAVAPPGVEVRVAVAQEGKEKVSFCPADNPPALHSNWVKREPVSFCTPTVAPDPLWVIVP